MQRTRSLTVVALVVLVAVAGCSAGGGVGGGGDAGGGGDGAAVSAEATGVPRAEAPDGGGGDGGDGGGSGGGAERAAGSGDSGRDLAVNRELIRTGQVHLRVESYETARQALTAAANQHGGFVSDSDEQVHRRDNRTWTTGTLVLRVPQENFDAVVERVKAQGEVLRADTNTKDVTDQVVDLEARLRNLKAQRERLRTLYDRANDTEDVLRVGNRLSEVQSEIERLEARLRSLERQVALSTITVDLSEPEPEPTPTPTPTPEPAFHETGLFDALVASIDGVVVLVRTLSVAVAYALPYLVVFAPPVAAAGYLVRRRERRPGPDPGEDPPE